MKKGFLLVLSLLFAQFIFAQDIEVTGTVTDEDGLPLPGVNITLKGTSRGTQTDFDGNYSINGEKGQTLHFSFVGFKDTDVSIGDDTIINISMEESKNALDAVVVTALGIKRAEKSLGYAVQEISGEDLTTVKGVSVATSLTGKVAGLNVRNSTEFDSDPSILLRGKSPLIVIDEVPFGNTSLGDIPADDIKDISILKGPAASALYGSRGGNGAIMVTTKRGAKEGFTMNVNSNTMFHAGYTRIPHPQTSYSTGNNGVYDKEDFVWGDKLDEGRTAVQYDPETYEWREMPLESKGKNNFKNFLQQAFVTNNNVSLAYKGGKGDVRASVNHVYNRG